MRVTGPLTISLIYSLLLRVASLKWVWVGLGGFEFVCERTLRIFCASTYSIRTQCSAARTVELDEYEYIYRY